MQKGPTGNRVLERHGGNRAFKFYYGYMGLPRDSNIPYVIKEGSLNHIRDPIVHQGILPN